MIKLLKYDIPCDNLKEHQMVKITLTDNLHKESFWVWVEEIQNNKIKGIISNNLIINNLDIVQTIVFDTSNIKEISSRSYTLDETNASIKLIKDGNNPITKYFESLNIKFRYLNTEY